MTFAWQTPVFGVGEQTLFGRSGPGKGVISDEWIWTVVDDVFGGSYRLLPSGIKLDRLNIPVGSGELPVQSPSTRVSGIHGPTITDQAGGAPLQTLGQGPASQQTETAKVKKFHEYKTWQDMKAETGYLPDNYELYATPKAYMDGVQIGAAPKKTPAKKTTTGSSSMDLGDIFGGLDTALDLYGKYQNVVNSSGGGGSTGGGYTPTWSPAEEIVDYFKDEATGVIVPVKKKKKCRRRRRRLATVSDIKDLAALRSVLGNGEAFKTWIATHSR